MGEVPGKKTDGQGIYEEIQFSRSECLSIRSREGLRLNAILGHVGARVPARSFAQDESHTRRCAMEAIPLCFREDDQGYTGRVLVVC